MKYITLSAALVLPFLGIGVTPALAANKQPACDISDLPCARDGKKCNIKFDNRTGRASGSGGSKYNQVSFSATIRVLAIEPDGGRAGSNTLTILADQTKTLNLGKKTGFQRIRIYSPGAKRGQVRMSCEDIRAVLKANKECKVFADYQNDGMLSYYLAYNCGVADGVAEKPFAQFSKKEKLR